MTPSRPYLLRALYDWIVDNEMTPHLVVNANFEEVEVPDQYIEDGQIILNVSPKAVRDLKLGNKEIKFCTKFSGVIYNIFLPIMSVTAIYAEENRKGMIFVEEELDFEEDLEDDSAPVAQSKSGKSGKKRPKTDVDQAYELGRQAIIKSLDNQTDIMLTIERTNNSPYQWQIGSTKLENVANIEKNMPKDFFSDDGFHISSKCLEYLLPLIHGEDYPEYNQFGLPDYIKLKNNMTK